MVQFTRHYRSTLLSVGVPDLVEPAYRDTLRLGVVVQSPPARTTVAAAGRADVAPDPAVAVPLVQMASSSDDLACVRIVVQALPAGAAVARTGRSGVAQIEPSLWS